jgi:hypothetical protein
VFQNVICSFCCLSAHLGGICTLRPQWFNGRVLFAGRIRQVMEGHECRSGTCCTNSKFLILLFICFFFFFGGGGGWEFGGVQNSVLSMLQLRFTYIPFSSFHNQVGIYLPCYDVFRNWLEEFTGQHVPSVTPYAPLVAGSLARSLACVSCYPIELAKTRMQVV